MTMTTLGKARPHDREGRHRCGGCGSFCMIVFQTRSSLESDSGSSQFSGWSCLGRRISMKGWRLLCSDIFPIPKKCHLLFFISHLGGRWGGWHSSEPAVFIICIQAIYSSPSLQIRDNEEYIQKVRFNSEQMHPNVLTNFSCSLCQTFGRQPKVANVSTWLRRGNGVVPACLTAEVHTHMLCCLSLLSLICFLKKRANTIVSVVFSFIYLFFCPSATVVSLKNPQLEVLFFFLNKCSALLHTYS